MAILGDTNSFNGVESLEDSNLRFGRATGQELLDALASKKAGTEFVTTSFTFSGNAKTPDGKDVIKTLVSDPDVTIFYGQPRTSSRGEYRPIEERRDFPENVKAKIIQYDGGTGTDSGFTNLGEYSHVKTTVWTDKSGVKHAMISTSNINSTGFGTEENYDEDNRKTAKKGKTITFAPEYNYFIESTDKGFVQDVERVQQELLSGGKSHKNLNQEDRPIVREAQEENRGSVPVRFAEVVNARKDLIFRGGLPTESQLKKLITEGIPSQQLKNANAKIGVIVNLLDPANKEDAALIAREKAIAEAAGIRFVNIPMPFDRVPPPEIEKAWFAEVDKAQAAKQAIFIHCIQGRDRTGSMIAQYRKKYDGYTSDQALAEMQSSKFGYNPSAYRWFTQMVKESPANSITLKYIIGSGALASGSVSPANRISEILQSSTKGDVYVVTAALGDPIESPGKRTINQKYKFNVAYSPIEERLIQIAKSGRTVHLVANLVDEVGKPNKKLPHIHQLALEDSHFVVSYVDEQKFAHLNAIITDEFQIVGSARLNKNATSLRTSDIMGIFNSDKLKKDLIALLKEATGGKEFSSRSLSANAISHFSRPVDYFMPKRGSQVTRYVLTTDMLKDTRDWALAQGLSLDSFMQGEGLGVGLYRGLKLHHTGVWADQTPEDKRNYEVALNFDRAMQAPTIGQSDWWSRTNFSIGTGAATSAAIYGYSNLLGFANNKKFALAAALIGGVAAGSVMSWMGSKFENAYGHDVFKQHGMRGPIDSVLLKISKRIDEDMSKLSAIGGQQDYGHSSTMQTIVGTSFDVIDTLVWNIATYEYLTLPALRLASSGYKRLIYGLEKRAYASASDKSGRFIGKSLSKGLLTAINTIDMVAMYGMGTFLEGAVLPYAGLFGKEVEKGVQQMTDVFKGKENYRAYRQMDRNMPGSLYRSFQIADETLSKLPFFKLGSTKGRTVGAVFAAYNWEFIGSVAEHTFDVISSGITDMKNRSYFANKMTTVEGQSVRTLDELKRLGLAIETAADAETKKLNIEKLQKFAKEESLDRLLSAQTKRTLRALEANLAEIEVTIDRLNNLESDTLTRLSAKTNLVQKSSRIVEHIESLKKHYYKDLAKLESPFTHFKTAIENWKNPFIRAYNEATGISGIEGGRGISKLAGAATGTLAVLATGLYALNGIVGSFSSAARVTLAEQQEYENMMNAIKGQDRVNFQIYRSAGFPRYDIDWGQKYGFFGKLTGGIVGLAQFYTERVRASLINMFGGPAKEEIDGRSKITNEIAGPGTFAMTVLALKAGNLSGVLKQDLNVKDALKAINEDGYNKKLSEEALLASMFMQPNANTDSSNISSSFAIRLSPARHIFTVTPFQQSSVRGLTTFSSSLMGPASLPIGVSITYPLGVKSYTVINKDGTMEKTYGGLFGLFDRRNYAKGRDAGTGIVWVPGTTFENMTYTAVYYHGFKYLAEKALPKKFYDSTGFKLSLKLFDFFYKINTLPFHVTKAVAGEILSLGGSFDFRKIGRAFTQNKGWGRLRVIPAVISEAININQDIKAFRTMWNSRGLQFTFVESMRVLVRSPLGKERLDSVISIVNEKINNMPEAEREAYKKAIGYSEGTNKAPHLSAEIEKGVSGQRITQSAYYRISKIKERILGGSASAQERTALEVFESSRSIRAIKFAGRAGAIAAGIMVGADLALGAVGSLYSEEFAAGIYQKFARFAINNLGSFGLWLANSYKVRYKEHPIATTYAPKYLPGLGENLGDQYEYREANLTGRILSYADHIKRTGQLFLKGLTEGVYSGLGYFGIVQDRIEEDKYATLKTYTNIPILGGIISYSRGITTPKEKFELKEYISAQNYAAGSRDADAYLRSMHRMNKKPAALGKLFHEQAGLSGLGKSGLMEQSRRTSLTHWVLANNSGFDTARYFFLHNRGPSDKSLFDVGYQPGSVEIAGFAAKLTYNKMMRMTKTAYSLFQSTQRSSQEGGELGQIDFSGVDSLGRTDQLFDSPSGVNAIYEHDLRAKNSLFSQTFTAGAIGILGIAAGSYIYKNRYPRKVSKDQIVSELDKKLNPSSGMQKVIDEYGPRVYGAVSQFKETVTADGRPKNFYMTTHGVDAAKNGLMIINDGEHSGSRAKYPGHRYWLIKIGSAGSYYTFGDLPVLGTDPLHNVSPANYKRAAAGLGLSKNFAQMNFAPVSEFFLQLTRMTQIGVDKEGSILAGVTNKDESFKAKTAVSKFKHLVQVHEDFYYAAQRMAASADLIDKQIDKKIEVLDKELASAKAAGNQQARVKILESMRAKAEFDKRTIMQHKTGALEIAAKTKTALHGNTENFNFKEAKDAIKKIKEIEAELNATEGLKTNIDAYNKALIEQLEKIKIGESKLIDIVQKINKSDLRSLAGQLGDNIDNTMQALGGKMTTETTLYKIQGLFGKGGLLAIGSASLKEKALGMRGFFPMSSATEIFTSYSRFWENTGNLNKGLTDWYNRSFEEFYRESIVKDVRSATAEAFNKNKLLGELSEETSQHAAAQWELFVRSYLENGEVLGSGVGKEGATALEEWRFVMQEFVQGDKFDELYKIAGAAALDDAKKTIRANVWKHTKFVGFKAAATLFKGVHLAASPLMYAGIITEPFKQVGTPFIGFGIASDPSYGKQDRELAAKAGLRDMGSGTASLGAAVLGAGAVYGIKELHSLYGKHLMDAGVTGRGIFGFAKDSAQRTALRAAAGELGKQAVGFFGKRLAIGAVLGVGLLEGITTGSILTGLVASAGVALGLSFGAVALATSLLVIGGSIAAEMAYHRFLKPKVDKWWNSIVDGEETKIVENMDNHSWLSAPGRAFNYGLKNLIVLANTPSTWFESLIQRGKRPDATASDHAWATTGSVLKYATSFIRDDSASNYFYQPEGITGTDLSSSEYLWRLPENAGPAGTLSSLTPIHYGTERNAINKLISQQERLREADPRSLLNFWFHPSNFGVETDMNNTTITGITPLSRARQDIFRSFSNLSVFGEATTTLMVGRSLETGHQLAQLLNRKFDFYNDKKNPEITKGQESNKAWAKINNKFYAKDPAYNVGLRGYIKLLPVKRNLSPFTTVVDSPFINSRTPDSTPTGIVLPTGSNKYTSGFNERRYLPQAGYTEERIHKGMDFAGRVGDPIYAAAAGKVVYAGRATGYGDHYIIIKHQINGVTKYTAYGHNEAHTVNAGDVVKAGQLIGRIGNEGITTGPHLHFSVSRNNPAYLHNAEFEDPAAFLRGRSLSSVNGGGRGGVDLPVSGLSIQNIKDATSKAMVSKNVKAFASMNRYKIAKDRLREYEEIIQAAHRKYSNVTANLIRAVITQESTGNNRSKSYVGAGGLMQLMPETAKDLGVKDRFNPRDNIFGGARYLSHQLIRYKGDVTKALMAYNAGPGNVDTGRAYSFSESTKYAPAVVAYLAMYNLEKPEGKGANEYTASSIPSATTVKHTDVTVAASTDVPAPVDNNPAKNMVRKAVELFESVIASAEKIFNVSTSQARKIIARATYPSGENWQSLYDNHYTPGIEFIGLDNHHGSVKH